MAKSIIDRKNLFLVHFSGIELTEKKYGEILAENVCIQYRNPVVFDNCNIKEFKNHLPYFIFSYDDKYCDDHILGMSNIVKFIYKNGLYKRCENNEEYFLKMFRCLNISIQIPKKLNDKGSFKNWSFSFNNINDCVNWNLKFKNEGIHSFNLDTGGFITVDNAHDKWYHEEFIEIMK